MTLISDLRDRLTRRKPQQPAAGETKAQKLAEQVTQAPPPPPRQEVASLESARDDINKLLGEIDTRLGAQRAETERLIKPIENLPEAVTEVKTQCGRVLEMVASQVEGSRGQAEALDAGFGSLRDASSQHGEVLGAIREQLEANTQAIRRAAESYESVTESIHDVLKICCKLQESLGAMAAEGRSDEVSRALARAERMFKLMAIAAGGAAVVAIVVAVMGLVV